MLRRDLISSVIAFASQQGAAARRAVIYLFRMRVSRRLT